MLSRGLPKQRHRCTTLRCHALRLVLSTSINGLVLHIPRLSRRGVFVAVATHLEVVVIRDGCVLIAFDANMQHTAIPRDGGKLPRKVCISLNFLTWESLDAVYLDIALTATLAPPSFSVTTDTLPVLDRQHQEARANKGRDYTSHGGP